MHLLLTRFRLRCPQFSKYLLIYCIFSSPAYSKPLRSKAMDQQQEPLKQDDHTLIVVGGENQEESLAHKLRMRQLRIEKVNGELIIINELMQECLSLVEDQQADICDIEDNVHKSKKNVKLGDKRIKNAKKIYSWPIFRIFFPFL